LLTRPRLEWRSDRRLTRRVFPRELFQAGQVVTNSLKIPMSVLPELRLSTIAHTPLHEI
jgi:hypothetical protein